MFFQKYGWITMFLGGVITLTFVFIFGYCFMLLVTFYFFKFSQCVDLNTRTNMHFLTFLILASYGVELVLDSSSP